MSPIGRDLHRNGFINSYIVIYISLDLKGFPCEKSLNGIHLVPFGAIIVFHSISNRSSSSVGSNKKIGGYDKCFIDNARLVRFSFVIGS